MQVEVVAVDAFASAVADVVEDACRTNQNINVCFTAGRTPDAPYAELVRRRQQLDLSRVFAFTLDEYAGIPKNHPQSCFTSLHMHLYDGVGVGVDRVVTYDDEVPPETAAASYEQKLADMGGLDFSILGIGLNGHVGFNEPGTPFDIRTHVPKLAEATLQRAKREGWSNPPTIGLTLGLGTLLESKQVLMIANGLHKAAIIERIVNGPISEDIPATSFRDHPNCLLLLDEDAASRL